MANLVYYTKEREEFKEAFAKELGVTESEMIYKKLCKHYKISPCQLQWTSGRRCPHAGWGITLNRDWNNGGILCHEFAHHLGRRKFSFNGHNKKHWRLMKRVIKYCEKKNWWTQELKRRTEPKPTKPEPTNDELRSKKIQSIEQSTKRLNSKIKRCLSLIKRNNRRLGKLRSIKQGD